MIINNTATFNGNELTNISGLTILATDPYKPARRKLSINDIANSNKSKITSAYYKEKDITMRVGISRSTRALLETSIDALLNILQGQEKSLILSQSGTSRRYTCTYADFNVLLSGGSYIELELVFKTSDHFGYDINLSELLQVSNFTSGQKTDRITVSGSAPWQTPIITITYTSITTGTSKAVRIGNDSTGQQISITRTWVTGDVLVIDVNAQTVKVNGTEVAFSGALPEWNTGVGYISYSDDFGARTYGMNVSYYKRYI